MNVLIKSRVPFGTPFVSCVFKMIIAYKKLPGKGSLKIFAIF